MHLGYEAAVEAKKGERLHQRIDVKLNSCDLIFVRSDANSQLKVDRMSNIAVSIDRVSISGISGWAIDRESDRPVRLSLEVDGHIVGEVTCNNYRADLCAVRKDGRLAFHLPMGNGFLSELPPDAHCRLVASDASKSVALKLPGTAQGGAFNPFTVDNEQRSLNKDGYFTVKFRDMTANNRQRALMFVVDLMEKLNQADRPCFLVYGTLLGCIRNQELIPHDDDFDLSVFFGDFENPGRIDDQSIELCRFLESFAYVVTRFSIGHIQVARGAHHADIFASWNSGNRFYLNFAINGEISPEEVFPLRQGMMSGVEFRIPHNSEALCQVLYGDDWRIPNSDFRWKRTGMNPSVDKDLNSTLYYWDRVYNTTTFDKNLLPSQFAAFAANEMTNTLERIDLVLDIGCGTARDTVFLAQFADRVCGVDGSATAIRRNKQAHPNIQFERCNFNDRRDCETLLTHTLFLINGLPKRYGCAYARFFLHAVDAEAENNFWEFCVAISQEFEKFLIFVEYRISEDEGRSKHTEGHYRRFVDHYDVISAAQARGLSVVYEAAGRGMAKYREDDAIVGRLVTQSLKSEQ